MTFVDSLSRVAQTSLTKQPKMLGWFRSDLFLYVGVIMLISALLVVVGFVLAERRKINRLTPHDYSGIPRDQRIFYELISDAVMGVRQRIGDKALDVAIETEGLVIDEHTGRVIKLTDSPSKVIAELVAGYERILGRKVNFSFRSNLRSKRGLLS